MIPACAGKTFCRIQGLFLRLFIRIPSMRLLAAIGSVLFYGVCSATPLHNIVVFGDSLSDNGNFYEYMKHQVPSSPPYYQGRFSNGPVWVEHLVASYFPKNTSTHLLNYAYGGATISEQEKEDTVFTLKEEVNSYLLAHDDKASDESLFIVWIGANNYLTSPGEIENALHDAYVGVLNNLQRLAEKGAKHVVVFNLPNLGRTPMAIESNTVDFMTYSSREHNKLLSRAVEHLKNKYPEVEWLYYDINQVLDEVMHHMQDYGFTNITESCIDSLTTDITQTSVLKRVASVKPKLNQNACDGYLFFDSVHPTASAHKILSEQIKMRLDEVGIQFEK